VYDVITQHNMFTVHPAESAGSSPTKSPSKKGIAADAAQSVFNLNPQAPTFGSFGAPGVAGPPVFQGNPSKRPLFPAVPPSNVTLGAVPSQGDNINAVHNTPETNPATGTSLPNAWHIPAVHSRGAAPTGSTLPRRPASPTTTKPGAAARVGRRDAWMRFMAYEGSVQICLDFVLQGVTEPAVQFLADGCRELRQALGIGQLLLSRAASGDAAEAAIYW